MNEMRKLMEIVETDGAITGSVNRFVLRHNSGAYVSNFSFGNNSNIAGAKLFFTADSAKIHAEELSDGWNIVRVRITVERI